MGRRGVPPHHPQICPWALPPPPPLPGLCRQEPSCGRSPLHLAVEAQCPEVVECLLRAGADPGARMYVGYTPLYSALHRPDRRIPQLLRDFGSQEPDWDSEPESPDDASDVSGAAVGTLLPPGGLGGKLLVVRSPPPPSR